MGTARHHRRHPAHRRRRGPGDARSDDNKKRVGHRVVGADLSTGRSASTRPSSRAHRPHVPAEVRHVDRPGRHPEQLPRRVLRRTSRRRPTPTPRASPTTASPSSCTSRPIRIAMLDYITAAIHNDDTERPGARRRTRATTRCTRLLPDVRAQGEPQVPARLGPVDRRRRRARRRGARPQRSWTRSRCGAVRCSTRAWTDELNARGVVCLGCFGVNTPQPNVFAIGASADQSSDQLTEYVSKRLANKPAKFAGDPALQTREPGVRSPVHHDHRRRRAEERRQACATS